MSSKKWIVMFILCILILAFGISAFNFVTDPFGIFGDRFFQWYSFDFTKNPRVAKISYLDQHYKEFDSYIIGSSASSSLSVDLLNRYMDARFYNLFVYGADMYDVEQITNYVIGNYKVKNIVLCLGAINAETYGYESDPFTDSLHAKTDNSPLLNFYLKYLYANPKYGAEKIHSYYNDRYLPQAYDVFDSRTGSYDKSLRDIERIQDMDTYNRDYPVFLNYPEKYYDLKYTDNFITSVDGIKNLCDSNGIMLKVIFFPLYYGQSRSFNIDRVKSIYERLAQITGFWDFSVNSITTDPRFYYDATHFRNALGDMALAKIFANKDVYIPQDYGVYVTSENAAEQAAKYQTEYIFNDNYYTKKVSILTYHHITSGDSSAVSPQQFEAHIHALSQAGYTGVSLEQLADYVEKGIDLPEKPIIITFDDGYSSIYEITYPILAKYNMKASIFIIGVSAGNSKYKDTDYPITPHFTYGDAREMIASGLIEIQSHSYDMHQWTDYETGTARTAVSQLEGESEESFINVLKTDFALSRKAIEANTGRKVFAFSYPLGIYSSLSEAVLKEMGIKVTLSTEPGTNIIIKGLPQSLNALKRYSVDGQISYKELIEMLNQSY